MDRKTVYDKILGSMVCCALGDAMGAVTENLSFDQIRDKYPGGVRELIAPDKTAFAYGNTPGQITDDFSQTYLLTEEIIKNNGVISRDCVEEMLIRWSNIPKYFNRFAGPTTRSAIAAIRAKKEGREYVVNEVIDYARQATNGSAMKISPAGFFNPGDVDKAIEDAVCVTRVTHDNQLAISGACATAAAISRAFDEKASVYDIIQAGIYGARKGEEIGMRISRTVGGPSVTERIGMAVAIAMLPESKEDRLRKIYNLVGTGLHVSEAVPAAFGIIIICDGDNWESVCEAVNVGYDTDTVAAIVGSIVGALKGTAGISEELFEILNRENEIALEETAEKVTALVYDKMK